MGSANGFIKLAKGVLVSFGELKVGKRRHGGKSGEEPNRR
jgi:hypothetical protein